MRVWREKKNTTNEGKREGGRAVLTETVDLPHLSKNPR